MLDMRSGSLRLIDNRIEELLRVRPIDRNLVPVQTQELLDHLVEEDYGFYCEKAEDVAMFPDISPDFHHPARIMDAILEVSSKSIQWLDSVLSQLNDLGCEHLEIRSYLDYSNTVLTNLINLCKENDILNITLRFKYSTDLDEAFILEIINDQEINLYDVQVFGCPDGIAGQHVTLGRCNLRYRYDSLDSRMCGIIDQSKFRVELVSYLASINHNTCLHRKFSMDRNGRIRNCPSMLKDYGHVAERPLASLLTDTDFTSVWGITKDQVEICKVCEFRNVCQDCRAFLTTPGDVNSKPLKCGYDPVLNTWQSWSQNPMAQVAIDYYNLIRPREDRG